MISDYEKLQEDLGYHVQKNGDLSANLGINVQGRRRAEDELLRVSKDFEEFKAQSRDTQARDSSEIVALQGKVRELQTRLD